MSKLSLNPEGRYYLLYKNRPIQKSSLIFLLILITSIVQCSSKPAQSSRMKRNVEREEIILETEKFTIAPTHDISISSDAAITTVNSTTLNAVEESEDDQEEDGEEEEDEYSEAEEKNVEIKSTESAINVKITEFSESLTITTLADEDFTITEPSIQDGGAEPTESIERVENRTAASNGDSVDSSEEYVNENIPVSEVNPQHQDSTEKSDSQLPAHVNYSTVTSTPEETTLDLSGILGSAQSSSTNSILSDVSWGTNSTDYGDEPTKASDQILILANSASSPFSSLISLIFAFSVIYFNYLPTCR